jgi:hypothetical protein
MKFQFLIVFSCFLLRSYAQVNLQTGAAQTNIPLYNYGDADNRLSVNISLAYIAGNGLKVSETPSSVGAGWMLDCGGFIQRIQAGEPDDQKQYETPGTYGSYNYTHNYYPDGYLHTVYPSTSLVRNEAANTRLFPIPDVHTKAQPEFLADREQDMFYFSFNGRSGYFVISKPGQNGQSQIRTIVDSKLLIDKSEEDMSGSQIRTTISEFTIKDESGIIYKFREKELDYTCRYDSTIDQAYNWQLIYGRRNNALPNRYVVNRWFLSEILNPLTGKKIDFQYEDFFYDMQGEKNFYISKKNSHNDYSLAVNRNIGIALRLKKIICSAKQTVEFEYDDNFRKDLPFDKQLSRIVIKYDNVIKYAWRFDYGYFVKNIIKAPTDNFSAEDLVWSRLCLLSLTKEANNSSSPPYKFFYYLGNEGGMNSAVPPLFSYLQDHWGYYNPTAYGYYMPADNSISPSNPPYEPFGTQIGSINYYEMPINSPGIYKKSTIEARNGVLKTVRNPLGGELSFEYEQQQIDPNTNMGGIRVKKIIQFDGLDHSKDIQTEYKYTKADGSSSAWGYEDYSNYYSENQESYVHSCQSNEYPGFEIFNSHSKLDLHGVYRESHTTSFAVDNPFSSIGSYLLDVYVINLFGRAVINYLIGTGSNNGVYASVFKQSKAFNLGNPLPFQYARTEVITLLNNSTTGKTVYEFTSPQDQANDPNYAIEVPNMAHPYSAKQRLAYWIYGSVKNISVFSANDAINPLRVTENIYKPIKYLVSDNLNASQKWEPKRRTYECGTTSTYLDWNETNNINHDIYYPMCGRMELSETKQYIYNQNHQSTVSSVKYYYNSDYLLKSTESTNSKDEKVEMKYYYPGDYTLPGPISLMQQSHIISPVLSKRTFIYKNGTSFLVSASIAEYDVVNGDVRPYNTYTFENTLPIAESLVSFNPNQLVPGSYFRQNGSIQYNLEGKASEVSSDAGKVCQIYDYDNKFLTASVVNASINDVAFTSFEAENKGNWLYQDQYIIADFSPTGRKNFKFPSSLTGGGVNISKINLNSANKYILSFWAKGGTPFVYKLTPPQWPSNHDFQLFSPQKTYANSGTGWTYYEYIITNSTSIYIDNSSHGWNDAPYPSIQIDEVKLYPNNASMSTLTYDPMIGKTSECDVNGRIIYYEYDDLGRVKALRDDRRNLIKAYEYNFKQ